MAPMEDRKQFAAFLRARRERLAPEQVGLPVDRRRRVPGLRREELAALAGLSTDYYTRLEQGRDHQPSVQVLAALAQALQLEADATTYLFALAQHVPRNGGPGIDPDERIDPVLQELIDGWATTPALVHGRRLDVLGSNAVGRALTPIAQPGRNMLRAAFLDDEVRAGYTDLLWTERITLAYFRASAGTDLDHPWFAGLVQELAQECAQFRRVWAEHDVQVALDGEKSYFHPLVGTIFVHYHTATVGTRGQTLLLLHAEPGTPDAAALARLASITASEPRR